MSIDIYLFENYLKWGLGQLKTFKHLSCLFLQTLKGNLDAIILRAGEKIVFVTSFLTIFWAWHKVWHHGVWVLKILSTIFLNKKTKRSQITMENAHFTSLEVDECLPSFQDLKLVTAIFFCFEKMYVPIYKQFRKFTIKYSKKNFVASFAPICRFIVRRVERYL